MAARKTKSKARNNDKSPNLGFEAILCIDEMTNRSTTNLCCFDCGVWR